MATREKLYTLRDLMEMPEDEHGTRYELSEGELIEVPPPNFIHFTLSAKIYELLLLFVRPAKLGRVGNQGGFLLHHDPKTELDTVREPDVAFIRAERLPIPPTPELFHGAPDLAVEVISPSETARQVESKTLDYFTYGTQLMWLVYPDTRRIHVYTSPKQSLILDETDMLTGGDVLPGFNIPVHEIFAELDSPPVQGDDQASS